MPIHVTSEIGKLKQALLYRPGIETQNYPEGHFGQVFSLRPSSSLFDLDRALAECDAYTSVLEHEGVEVLYLDQLLIEALDSCPEARASFVDSFVDECGAIGAELQQAVREHLEHTRSAQELVSASIGGIRHGQVTYCFDGGDRLAELTGEAYAPDELLVSPLNTMWFVRDPVSTIGSGISFNHMYWPERNREVALYQTIFKYHPNFKDTPSFYRHDSILKGAISSILMLIMSQSASLGEPNLQPLICSLVPSCGTPTRASTPYGQLRYPNGACVSILIRT